MGVQDEEADDLQVATVYAMSMDTASITQMLQEVSLNPELSPPCDFGDKQMKDKDIKELTNFMKAGDVPADSKQARKLAATGSLCTMQQMSFTVQIPSIVIEREQWF